MIHMIKWLAHSHCFTEKNIDGLQKNEHLSELFTGPYLFQS